MRGGRVLPFGPKKLAVVATEIALVRIKPSEPRPLLAEGHLDSAELFRRYGRFVASFLLRLGVARGDLDDLMQEVFLVAHRNGGYTPGPAKPTTYLANIAFKATISDRRKRKTRGFVKPSIEAVERATTERATPEHRLEHAQQLRQLQTALAALDDDKRAVFVMAEIEGETVVSIAAAMGIPVDTAYSRLRAARKLFRKAVADQREDSWEDTAPTMVWKGASDE